MAQAGMNARTASYGRGGAGNMNSKPSAAVEAHDLKTPTLKHATYTTGRGGTGNMATNDPTNPAIARASQDVEAPGSHEKEATGTFHWGRGGQGNVTTIGKERTKSKERRGSGSGPTARRGSMQTTLEKGKALLGLGGNGKKSEKEASPSAIE